MALEESQNMKDAVKNASYNMVLQIFFRLSTFSMNAVMLRYLSREILGVMNVRLMLLYSTMLFISREAFRKSCLTQQENNNDIDEGTVKIQLKQMMNLTWVCSIIGLLSSIVLYIVWTSWLPQPTSDIINQYQIATLLIALSCVIELVAEPFWILSQRNYFLSLKVIFEGVYLAVRCFLSTLLVVYFPKSALLMYGISFLLASIIYLSCYAIYFWKYMSKDDGSKTRELLYLGNFSNLMPDMTIKPMFHQEYMNLVASFYKQSMLKQFLTEGERYIMTIFGILTFSQQGVYDVINNLGSLAARFIFMPIEETYYTYFSKVLSRGKCGERQNPDNLNEAANSLFLVLKFVTTIGTIILVFGYSYSFMLLDLYGGKILSENEGPSLLKAYCLYVFIIAINGITECFMFATMSKDDVDRYNYKMLLFSVVFLCASLLFTSYMGSIGFIFANCLNMALRIVQSSLYIVEFFKETTHEPLSATVPSKLTFSTLFLSFVVMSLSEITFCCHYGFIYQLCHVAVGAVCLLIVLASVYLTEHKLVQYFKSMLVKEKRN